MVSKHQLLQNARHLRKSLTDAERKLWMYLRRRYIGHHRFRRQVPLGPYIVDFVCYEVKVIIELDGSQHMVQQAYDERRTSWFECHGFIVKRFWNNEVLQQIQGVLTLIKEICDCRQNLLRN